MSEVILLKPGKSRKILPLRNQKDWDNEWHILDASNGRSWHRQDFSGASPNFRYPNGTRHGSMISHIFSLPRWPNIKGFPTDSAPSIQHINSSRTSIKTRTSWLSKIQKIQVLCCCLCWECIWLLIASSKKRDCFFFEKSINQPVYNWLITNRLVLFSKFPPAKQ